MRRLNNNADVADEECEVSLRVVDGMWDLSGQLRKHLRWRPRGSTFLGLQEDLHGYLTRTLPERSSVLMNSERGDTPHLVLNWRGLWLPERVDMELAVGISSRFAYDALVGRIEQITLRNAIVVVVPPTDGALVAKLRERYRDRLFVIEAVLGSPDEAQPVSRNQLPDHLVQLIRNAVTQYNQAPTIELVDSIPKTSKVPIQDGLKWLSISDAICVCVDMKGSTALSASTDEATAAATYRLFTDTIVRFLHAFDSPYIDIQGDGAFALFDATTPHGAYAAALACQTFARHEFSSVVTARTGCDVGCRIGIDRSPLMVRRLGLKRFRGRSDRQNEVWAGRTVNVAFKLAELAHDGQLVVSERFFERLSPEAVSACCERVGTWRAEALASERFDFATAYRLEHAFCSTHGREVCERLLASDDAIRTAPKLPT